MNDSISLSLPYERGTQLRDLAVAHGVTVTDAVGLLLDHAARTGLGKLAKSDFNIAVGKERPDLVTAFNPWDRITDVVSVRKLLQDGGVRDAEVIPEESVQLLHSAHDWWTIALGSGLRWTIDQMGPEAATRVKQDNVDWLTENKIDRVETNAIYAIGTKGP